MTNAAFSKAQPTDFHIFLEIFQFPVKVPFTAQQFPLQRDVRLVKSSALQLEFLISETCISPSVLCLQILLNKNQEKSSQRTFLFLIAQTLQQETESLECFLRHGLDVATL